jgi:hypothetical protein
MYSCDSFKLQFLPGRDRWNGFCHIRQTFLERDKLTRNSQRSGSKRFKGRHDYMARLLSSGLRDRDLGFLRELRWLYTFGHTGFLVTKI